MQTFEVLLLRCYYLIHTHDNCDFKPIFQPWPADTQIVYLQSVNGCWNRWCWQTESENSLLSIQSSPSGRHSAPGLTPSLLTSPSSSSSSVMTSMRVTSRGTLCCCSCCWGQGRFITRSLLQYNMIRHSGFWPERQGRREPNFRRWENFIVEKFSLRNSIQNLMLKNFHLKN